MKKRLCKVFLIILATLFAFAVGSCSVGQEPVPQSYTVQYVAGTGGTIQGKATQIVEEGKNAETVTAVPDEGYSFVKWSDGVTSAERQDVDINSNLTVTASFSNKYKTFKLDCGYGYLENNQTEITFSKVNFKQIDFPVPIREGFAFNGWYIGSTKVTDESGKMLIDESILNRSSTITAKWTVVETFTYKILLVCVTRIDAELLVNDLNSTTTTHIDYTMSNLERTFCQATAEQLRLTMNDMLDGLVNFEIDPFFTNEPIVAEYFSVGEQLGFRDTTLYPDEIPEVADMISDYDACISVSNIGMEVRHPNIAGVATGSAGRHVAEVRLDQFIKHNTSNNAPKVTESQLLTLMINSDYSLWTNWLEVFLHEHAHIVEYRILGNYVNTEYSYHRTGASYSFWIECKRDHILANKLYYLQAIEKNGIKVGIPYGFWARKIATVNYYSPRDAQGWFGGTIDSSKTGVAVPVGSANVRYEIVYGDSITVTAVPITGYEFVGWSDGVTTATRTDLITGDFEVTAIFQPITYELTIVAGEGGIIKYGGGTRTLQYNGSYIVITAEAQEGYRFVGWSDGETNYSRSFGVRLSNINLFDEDHSYTLTAIFEKIN